MILKKQKTKTIRQSKGRLYPPPCFLRTSRFSLNLTGMLNLDNIVHYHWSRMEKIGNTICLIGNLNILGYMNIVSMRTTCVPSQMVIHQCISKVQRKHKHVYSGLYMSRVTLHFEAQIRVKVTALRLNEDSIYTRLGGNPSMHT